MTITPQYAKIIKTLVDAHRDWVHSIFRKNDVEADIALRTMKQALDDFRATCPECGYPIATAQPRRDTNDGHARTHLYCHRCKTSIVITTPPSHG